MTVPVQVPSVVHTGNGVTNIFPYPYLLLLSSDMSITIDGVDVLPSAYSVSGVGQDAGGSVTFLAAPPSLSRIVMRRDVGLSRATDYQYAGDFQAETVNNDFDRLWMALQDYSLNISTALRFPSDDTTDPLLPSIAGRALTTLAFDAAGALTLIPTSISDATGLALALGSSANTSQGAGLVGYDGGSSLSVLDGAKTLANYTAMRAYAGRATDIRPTNVGPAGQFYRDPADTTTADDGGTVIVDALNRRWKRTETDTINVKWFGAVGDGVTDDTAAVQAATTRAAAQGKGVHFPAGTFLVGALTLPAGLSSFSGKGKRATVLKFKRIAYASLTALLDARNNTAAIELSGFTIDCDDVLFKSAPVRPINLSGSNGAGVRNLRIVGRGDAAIYADGVSDVLIDAATVDCTGVGGSSFVATLYMTNATDVTVRGLRTTGLPGYAAGFALGCLRCHFIACHTDGTATGFGFWFDGANRCSILECTAKNTYAEAFQCTNGSYNLIAFNNAEWDNTHGIDAGISVHAEAGFSASFNQVIGNNITNSYQAGLLCANNAAYNVFAENTLRQAAVRGTAAALSGTGPASMGQYTDIAGAQCSSNTFRANKVIIEGGTVAYGFAEFNVGGGGSSVVLTKVWDNEFHAAGGTITARYLIASANSSIVADVDWISFAPTLTPASGSLNAAVATSAKFRRRGESTEITMDFTITDAGSGAGPLTVLWPGAPNAGTNGGAICGVNTVSRKMVAGAANAGGVVLALADGTTPIATGARIVVSGTYRVV